MYNKIKLRYLISVTFLLTSNLVFSQTVINIPLYDANACDVKARDRITISNGVTITPYDGPCSSHVYRIDESIIAPTNYVTSPIDPDNRILDLSLPVGTIEGFGSVNSSGGAIYSIPIYCPSGTNKMQPNISIDYNSQSGMGLLGYGWNLSGLSVITRTGQNYFCDSPFVNDFDFDSGDYFTLDGNRLEVKSGGTYGQNGAIYTTRTESFYKIISYGVSGNGPEYFKIITKEGVIMEYGNTNDSRVEAYDLDGNTNNSVLTWRLNKMTDQNGNYIEYTYEEFTLGQTNFIKGESFIKSIKYTGNTSQGITPYNTINFYYESRLDENTSYYSGAKVPDRLILRSIKVKNEDNLVKEYKFDYIDNFLTSLYKINEYNSDGSHYNSTLIKWGKTPTPPSNATTAQINDFSNTGLNTTGSRYLTGDFNGDGISDVLIVYEANPPSHNYPYPDLYLGSSTGTINRVNLSSTIFFQNFYDIYVVDYNNDGIDEIIVELASNSSYYYQKYYFAFNTLNHDGLQVSIADPLPVQSADLNGDGTNEVFFLNSNNEVTGFIGTSQVPLAAFDNIQPYPNFNRDYNFDFNGDGKSDILNVSGSKVQVYEYNPTTHDYGTPIHSKTINLGSDPTQKVFPGDFNGDGKTDLLYYYVNGSPPGWKICYSSGKEFDWNHQSSVTFDANIQPNVDLYNHNYYVCDVNGDGKSDIIELFYTNGCSTYIATLNIYLSKGRKSDNSTGFEKLTVTECIDNLDYMFQNNIRFGDFNGDGNVDILWKWSPSVYKTYFINKDGEKNIVTSVVDGINKFTHFEYSTLAKGDCYTKGINAVFPVNDIQAPIYVVKRMETPNISTSNFITDYAYEGAKYHRQGLGFLGFVKTKKTDQSSYSKLRTETTNNIQLLAGFFFILPETTEVYNNSNLLVKKSSYANSSYSYFNGPKQMSIFPYINSTINYDFLTNTKNSQNVNYNIDGNILNSETSYFNGTGSIPFVEKITTSNSFNQIGQNAWLPNFLTHQSITKERDGQPVSRHTDYTYNGNNCNLMTVITDQGMAKSVTTTYNRNNNCGVITSTQVSSAGLNNIINNFEYDDKYRFCTKTTNALSQFSTKTYEPLFGNVINESDINGNFTSHFYDSFGRIIKTHAIEGDINYSLGWAIGGTFDDAIYFSNIIIDGAPDTKTYYDILGRDIMTETDGLNQKIYSSTKYALNGAKLKVSNPHFQGITASSTTYLYDDVSDRLSSANFMGLSITTYSYNGRTISVTDPALHTTSKTIDAAGRTESVEDANGGILSYTYTSAGNTKTITDGGSTITIGYDQYDRQNSLTDPNTGNYFYEYNAYGQLVTQTDAKANTYQITYDVLGRIKTKNSITDGNLINYTYDIETNGLGKIAAITDQTGMSQHYKYDQRNRISQFIETIPGQSNFTTSYLYDNFNNITKITYPGPNSYSINKTYDINGNLIEVKQASDNKSIWKLDEMDYWSNITQYKTANNTITSNITYGSTYGELQEIKTGSIFDYSYIFNLQSGNLTQRKDKNRNLTENFSYDNLYRLTTAGSFNATINYLPNGNIQNKWDVSSSNYVYSNLHPNAVETIENSVGNVSSLTQTAEYTSFNKILHIGEVTNTSDLDFFYGVDQERKKMETKVNNSLTTTKYYTSNFEREISNGNTKEWNYISGGDGLAAIYIVNNGIGNLYWVAKDHLGSIMGLYNESGTMVEEFNYDAWGRRRDPDTRTYISGNPSNLITRGYTGHEYLDNFALINMNGRLYDPILGRMLSPDFVMQNPTSTQAFNKYSYCQNNPLKYTDPSGWNVRNFGNGNGFAPAGSLGNGSGYEYDIPSSTYIDFSQKLHYENEYNSDGSFYNANGSVSIPSSMFQNICNIYNNLYGGNSEIPLSSSIENGLPDGGLLSGATNGNNQNSNINDLNYAIINGEGGSMGWTIRSNDVNWRTLSYEFFTGTGPEKSLFLGVDNPMVHDLIFSHVVDEAIDKFDNNGKQNLINYDASWRIFPETVSTSPFNMTEQFIGGARVSIINWNKGYLFMVTDTKDRYSLYYHIKVESYQRQSGSVIPQSTTYQRYIWWMPY